MKHIVKGNPIAAFVDFVDKEHPTNWDDIRSSKRHPNLSSDCRNHILQSEQCNNGGYTERPLWNEKNLHIDHFRKKGLPWKTDVTFDWNNLIVEDRNPFYGACYKDKYTNSIEDYQLLLNPAVDYPEDFFTYSFNGEIVAKDGLSDNDRQRAEFTISRFNLNHETLRKVRGELITTVLSYGQLDDDIVRQSLESYGFPTVVEWVLKVRH
jgi:uncharacterized protein (TIGR02646 family)